MSIVNARRISQIFFLILFLWFCIVTTLGDAWWQLRGWPVNWIIEIDPLVGLGTLLTTHTVYAGLAWGLATVVLTILLGRFFCGWVCPFGSIHQFIGYLGRRKRTSAAKARINRYSPWQVVKYWILIFLLAMALADLLAFIVRIPLGHPWIFLALTAAVLVVLMIAATTQTYRISKRAFYYLLPIVILWAGAAFLIEEGRLLIPSLQIGLLDPIPLLYRSINFLILPLVDRTAYSLNAIPRYYDSTVLIGIIFFSALFLNLKFPRFYCRFVCPLGALFGIIGRYAIWRIGKTAPECTDCYLCERNCEGACGPSATIRINECVLCMNCRNECRHDLIEYRTAPSAAGEIVNPDLSRRQFVVATVSGIAAIPVLRLNGYLAANWNPRLVRPPGALDEDNFLLRCIKCGQCMRVCPTNVIHPAGLELGIEGLWTPVLNFRIGTSGCQQKCIACGNICPTAAIRPISLDERLGKNGFAVKGPLRIGTAFVDRGRCLPWAMNTPCIVCQENCPVSPKAIEIRKVFTPVITTKQLIVRKADAGWIELEEGVLPVGRFAGGDHFCNIFGRPAADRRRIVSNTEKDLTLSDEKTWNNPPAPGSRIEIQIRLQQPWVNAEYCIGCGICEHECPVRGLRAIRVTAENETRSPAHKMIL